MSSEKSRFRNRQVKFRVTDAEYQSMVRNMEKCKMSSLGKYIRIMAIDGCILVVDDSASIDQLNYQIGKIGNNINQIAHHVNATETVTVNELSKVLEMMEQIWQLQRSILSNSQPYLQ